MSTLLIYLNDMYKYQTKANILNILEPIDKFETINQDKYSIILDQTIFYPQAGGQPSDKGFIKSNNGIFQVESVYFKDGIVYHNGIFLKGSFNNTEQVNLEVDQNLRELHNKNHSAGHLIDYALDNLGYKFEPVKAYHFPAGPYVEYKGILSEVERKNLQEKLESEVNNLVKASLNIKIGLLDNDPNKRIMFIEKENYTPILCGGTHVKNTSDIKEIKIRKIKNEKGNLRVSYLVN